MFLDHDTLDKNDYERFMPIPCCTCNFIQIIDHSFIHSIAGKSNCPYFARIELLADALAKNLPNFEIHKILIVPDEWEVTKIISFSSFCMYYLSSFLFNLYVLGTVQNFLLTRVYVTKLP